MKKRKRIVLADALADVEGFLETITVEPAVSSLLVGGTVEARASMYVNSTYATYENNVVEREKDEGVTLGRRVLEAGDNCDDCIVASSEEFVPLDELPEIGDSVCQSRCRCEFEFQIDGDSFRTSDIFSGVVSGQEQYGGDVEVS